MAFMEEMVILKLRDILGLISSFVKQAFNRTTAKVQI